MRSILKKEFQQGKRRDMTKFTIGELSSVTRPASEPSLAAIMKRKHSKPEDDETDIKKIGWITVVTSADQGHGHVLELYPGEDKSGHTDFAVGVGDTAEEHRHAWYIDDEGQIQIVMNQGHLHAVERDAMVNAVVAMVSKSDLDEETLVKIQKNFPEIATTEDVHMDEIKKALERANSVIALSSDHRTHFDTIEKVEDQDSFLAKSVEERTTIVAPKVEKVETPKVEKTEDKDVVYTATNGSVFTKSDDPRLVAAVIESDTTKKQLDAQLEKSKDAEFLKRAESELAHLPGTPETRARLLKSVESIEDEGQRGEALKALRAGSDAAALHTTPIGSALTTEIPIGDAYAELQKLATAEQTKSGGTPEAAFSKVCDTPEGGKLYAEHRQSMVQH